MNRPCQLMCGQMSYDVGSRMKIYIVTHIYICDFNITIKTKKLSILER